MQEIEISLIDCSTRKRKMNPDKAVELARSILEVGLINPITVKEIKGRYILLAGAHRLQAYRHLMRTTIPAIVFVGDDLDAEMVEIDENLRRNDLTILEQSEHLQRRNEILDEMGMRARSGTNKKNILRTGELSSPVTENETKTTGDIASEIGLSERSVQIRGQIARNIIPEVRDAIRETDIADSKTQLLSLARMKPEEQIKIADEVKASSNEEITLWDIIAKQKTEEREAMHASKRSKELPKGKYSVIYADPPWKYDNSGFDESADAQYPTMELEEICALPIQKLCDETTILFMWATNPLLPEAMKVLNAWGFEYKSNIAWVKDAGRGKGWFLKSKHELILIGVKSNTPHPQLRPDSCFEAERGNIHSRKPVQAYEIIESMYPGKKIELFARIERKGWESWGNEL